MTAPLSLLIHTDHDDLHALAVATAWRARGHRAVRLLGADLPSRTAIEFAFGDEHDVRNLHGTHGVLALGAVDAVWNRRPAPPRLPDHLAPADREFAWSQSVIAQRSLDALLRDAFWANAPLPVRDAGLKPLQLQLAGPAGLAIAPTLVSNEPASIRAFIATHPSVIYKPLHGHIWHEDGVEFGSYTARVRLDDLPADRLLRATPGIFQAQVQKQFEVRAQFFGDSCFAVRIESQRIEYGEFDWRLHQHGDAISQAIELPPAVHAACRRFMQALGLVCGGFDFIVTPDDEWIFLEVNEAGQFLFLEMWCPQLPLIDACCAFLASRDPAFRYREPAWPMRYVDLDAAHRFESQLQREKDERMSSSATDPVHPDRIDAA